MAMRAKTPPPRGEDKAMKAKSPPRWGVGSGSSVATGAGQRGGVCPPLGTPAPVRSHPFGGQTNLPPMEDGVLALWPRPHPPEVRTRP